MRCGICDRSLSGGWTRGRLKRYGYYDCKSCQGVRIAKAELEEGFMELLDRLRPAEEVLKLLSAAVLDRWSQEQKGTVGCRSFSSPRGSPGPTESFEPP